MDELNGVVDEIDYQTAYLADIIQESNYGYKVDASEIYKVDYRNKQDNITTYRSRCFTSLYTGTKSTLPHTPFMQEFDDSMQHFLSPDQ